MKELTERQQIELLKLKLEAANSYIKWLDKQYHELYSKVKI